MSGAIVPIILRTSRIRLTLLFPHEAKRLTRLNEHGADAVRSGAYVWHWRRWVMGGLGLHLQAWECSPIAGARFNLGRCFSITCKVRWLVPRRSRALQDG